MSYLRNYVLIALGLYMLSVIKNFLQVGILCIPWYNLKTTNLFIMYYVERLYAYTKKNLYTSLALDIQIGGTENIRININRYGLMRDKIYCMLICIFYNIKNIFGVSKRNKRNYFAIVLTILFTKRDTLIRLSISLYNKRVHYRVLEMVHKFYKYIGRINIEKVKKLGVCVVGIVIFLIIINELLKLKNTKTKKYKLIQENGTLVQLQLERFETLDILQNKLGEYILLIVDKVRMIDKMLVQNSFENYKEIEIQVVKELNDCKNVLKDINNHLVEIEQVKDVEIYQVYNHKFSVYTLTLIDLSKELDDEEVLKKYQKDVTYENRVYDVEFVEESREILYDYLKKCLSYYNELDQYLIKIKKGKRRIRKKIYKKEQIENMETPSQVIRNYLEEKEL